MYSDSTRQYLPHMQVAVHYALTERQCLRLRLSGCRCSATSISRTIGTEWRTTGTVNNAHQLSDDAARSAYGTLQLESPSITGRSGTVLLSHTPAKPLPLSLDFRSPAANSEQINANQDISQASSNTHTLFWCVCTGCMASKASQGQTLQ